MYIKFLVIIIQFIYSTISIADIIGMNYQNGIVSTTALKYTNQKLAKSVSVVGIIHYGTNEYYHRIAKYLESLEDGTILLDEFARCDSTQTLTLDFNQCDDETIQKAWSQSLFPASLNKYLNLNSEVFMDMQESGFLTKTQCRLDPYSHIPRPAYIVERNDKRCEDAHKENLVCQHEKHDILQPSNLRPKHSDIVINDTNLGEQLLAILLYRTDNKKECNRSNIIKKIFENPNIEQDALTLNNTINHFNLTHRDHILINKLFSALKHSNNVATLWGAVHSYALHKALLSAGYELVSNKKIHYMSDEEGISWTRYQDIIESTKINIYDFLR